MGCYSQDGLLSCTISSLGLIISLVSNLLTSIYNNGELAHLVERLLCTQGVIGSTPILSTIECDSSL
jgi:hypothetical protein